MSQATADLEETAPVEQSEEEFDSDLMAGYANDGQESDSTATPNEEPDASAHPDPETSDAKELTLPATQEEAVDKLTAAYQRIDELEAKHKKYSDDVYGRVGMLEQVLKAQARTPAGQKVQVKIEDFGEFGSEYPDFAQAQLKVINKALSELELTGLSQEFIAGLKDEARQHAESAAAAKFSRERSDACREELDETHPGWMDTIGLPDKDESEGGIAPDTEYRRWLKTQPKEYADRVLKSYSPVVIGKSLDKFNAYKQLQQKPKPQQTQSTGLSRREQQLRSAVPARTTGVTPRQKKEMTEDEAMLASFHGRL